jgi:hypothetical protein
MPGAPPPRRDDINIILRGADREIRALLRIAHDQDFLVTPTSGNHYAVSTPEGVRPKKTVFMSKTPSDTRGLHRMRRKLRGIGVVIPR